MVVQEFGHLIATLEFDRAGALLEHAETLGANDEVIAECRAELEAWCPSNVAQYEAEI